MLLNGKNRKTITKIGSTAALGYLAYRGYQMWQQNKGRATVTQSDFQPAGETEETYSRTVLRTMIATAASDGMIDEAERRTIEQESGTDPETAAWLAAEYRLPASIEDIAAAVGNDDVGGGGLSGGKTGMCRFVAERNRLPRPPVAGFGTG